MTLIFNTNSNKFESVGNLSQSWIREPTLSKRVSPTLIIFFPFSYPLFPFPFISLTLNGLTNSLIYICHMSSFSQVVLHFPPWYALVLVSLSRFLVEKWKIRIGFSNSDNLKCLDFLIFQRKIHFSHISFNFKFHSV